MKFHKRVSKTATQPKRIVVTTTFSALIGKLIDGTNDDDAIIASVKRIFDCCEVRMGSSLAPVRLISGPSGFPGKRRAAADKGKPVWAQSGLAWTHHR